VPRDGDARAGGRRAVITRTQRRLIGAETEPGLEPPETTGARSGFLTATLAALLLAALLASIHVWRSTATGADLHVRADGDVPVVLCVVHGAQARCVGKDEQLAGRVDGGAPAVCGLADRRLAPACPPGRECVFENVAPASAFGLVLLEPKAPVFGVPRNRVIDTAVLTRGDAGAAARIAAGVQELARCFAPTDSPESGDVILNGGACERTPCRLRQSRVRIAADPVRAATDGSTPSQGGNPHRSGGG
jgi:hypothetical protein